MFRRETKRSAPADHTGAGIPSRVNFSAWLMRRPGGGRDFLQYLRVLCECEVEGYFFSKTVSLFMQNGNKIAFLQQSVLTIRLLPGFPGRKVLTLCAPAIWDVSGLLSCRAGVNLQDAVICLSFDPCGECVIYRAATEKKERKMKFVVAKAFRQTLWSNRQ